MFFFEVGVGFITRIVWGPKATLVAVGVGVSSYLSINIALLTPRNWLITTGKFYKKYFAYLELCRGNNHKRICG